MLFWAFLLVASVSIAQCRETVYDAAVIARKLVSDPASPSIGTMATIFPSTHPSLSGQPFSLQEYFARRAALRSAYNNLTSPSSCLTNGSITLIFLPISQHSRNILSSPTHEASLSISALTPSAGSPRVSFIGNVTIFTDVANTPALSSISACYLQRHPDAKGWLPGDKRGAHISYWARFDPQSIYFVGGFGDEHYIGFIPPKLYQDALVNVTEYNRYDQEHKIEGLFQTQ